jgi:hypothetical protein
MPHLIDNLYTKRQYLSDLAQCANILHLAREGVCDRTVRGLDLMRIETQVAACVKLAKARWAENGRWFGALERAKRDWARKQFGEHDHESLKKLKFLKFVVSKILDGVERSEQ